MRYFASVYCNKKTGRREAQCFKKKKDQGGGDDTANTTTGGGSTNLGTTTVSKSEITMMEFEMPNNADIPPAQELEEDEDDDEEQEEDDEEEEQEMEEEEQRMGQCDYCRRFGPLGTLCESDECEYTESRFELRRQTAFQLETTFATRAGEVESHVDYDDETNIFMEMVAFYMLVGEMLHWEREKCEAVVELRLTILSQHRIGTVMYLLGRWPIFETIFGDRPIQTSRYPLEQEEIRRIHSLGVHWIDAKVRRELSRAVKGCMDQLIYT